MVLQTTLDRGQGMIEGDIFSIYRTINNIPVGETVSQAWLMIKTAYSVADGSATISKQVTSSNVAGTGQIEDTGSSDQSARIRFDLTNSNTTAITADTVTYVYSIKILLSGGSALTLERGTVVFMSAGVDDVT